MGIVHLLDSETINQIAAGEVIERPASIVKELVENAIDSGATAVTIDITGGGISSIRITDNGSGFAKEDIPVAFLRHATSKITKGSDLLSIQSLGFRGEALSSIAAVSRLELLTKQPNAYLGSRYCIEGGQETCFEDAGCPTGTTIIVNDLFYNVPARRKFLKSATTEAGYISELVNRFAISHPAIAFSLIINNRTALHTSGNGNQKDAIYSVYGREIAMNLIPVSEENELFTVHGFIGKPQIARGNRTYENYFVNGRYIKSTLISKAIEEAYASYSMQHKYPFTALTLTINPSEIDVNIHPTKMDVRFSEGERLYSLLRTVIANALRNAILIPDMRLTQPTVTKQTTQERPPEHFETNRLAMMSNRESEKKTEQGKYTVPEASSKVADHNTVSQYSESSQVAPTEKVTATNETPTNATTTNVTTNIVTPTCKTTNETTINVAPSKDQSDETPFTTAAVHDNSEATTTTATEPSKPEPLKPEPPKPAGEQLSLFTVEEQDESGDSVKSDFMRNEVAAYRIVGQIFSTYWIVEMDNRLFYIDQHAAHEKILYERMLHDMNTREVCSQQISPPTVVSLSIREEETLLHNLERFEALGFDIQPFGDRDYAIYAVPMTLYRLTSTDYFHSLLDEMLQMPKNTPNIQVLESIASMSCKAAIKGNQSISYEEAKKLIEELLTLENPYHCPHGRPIIVSLSKYELEKKFKRIL